MLEERGGGGGLVTYPLKCTYFMLCIRQKYTSAIFFGHSCELSLKRNESSTFQKQLNYSWNISMAYE
jgi:hypothetical protein